MPRLAQALAKMDSYVRDQQIFSAGAKLLLCVSGGADSVALLLLISRLRSLRRLTLLAVHVDHQLRGAESAADAELVKQLCQDLSVPLIIRKVRLDAGGDLENRARQKRFQVFEEVLEAYRFDLIVTAHHRQDQTETMLLNLFRGAGLSGLAGIRPRSGNVAHPLLCFDKEELTALLEEQKIPWREDASNADQGFKRNWIRHTLLPLVATELNPRVASSLGEQAAIFAGAEELILQRVKSLTRKVTLEQLPERITLSIPALRRCMRLEQYYLLKEHICALSGSGRDFFSRNFEDILGLLASEGSKQIQLGRGLIARKVYAELSLELEREAVPVPEPVFITEDRARAVWGDHRFTFKLLKVLPPRREQDDSNVYLDADRLNWPLTIRSRRPGDRFMPLGMDALVKLKDFFINAKVGKYERDFVPVLDDGEKIIWIAGQRLDARAALDKDSARFLHISVENLKARPLRAASRKKTGDENE
ncbi:MAG: tRNA lysidine(34) synthetase TilS [Candidatus Cloacimonetes bacterium]|nr:tRNA lysidine(34) synthetase TilS [Candidatus Cloacimonadota bacterium]